MLSSVNNQETKQFSILKRPDVTRIATGHPMGGIFLNLLSTAEALPVS